jgi:hypothetical protein
MYKTKLPLFASKEKHIGKKHYFILFLHKDFDRSKNFPNLRLTDKTFFFWLTPWEHIYCHGLRKHFQLRINKTY